MSRTFFASLLVSFLVVIGYPPLLHASEPVLVYQRIHTLVNHHDNRISMRLWEDGSIEVRFPHYSPMAGQFRWQVSDEERNHLTDVMSKVEQISQHEINQELRQARHAALIEIADADMVRIEQRLNDRAEVTLFVESPELWSRKVPGWKEMKELADVEKQLLEWIRHKVGERTE
jgi:uncharacterized membrane protein